MSYFLRNLRRVGREVSHVPLGQLPGTLVGYAKPKLEKTLEEVLYRSGLMDLASRRFAGHGIALMFHEIQDDVEAELYTGCPQSQLATIIAEVRRTGREIVTIAEGLRRLADPDGSAPFALLTFDDAYRDNMSNALPVLEETAAPMTLFVPTGMITRRIDAWWLGVRELLRTDHEVPFLPMERVFQCRDLAEKSAALRQVTAWIGTDQSRADKVIEFLSEKRVDGASLVQRYAMDRDTLRTFAAHPLVTIGAHTDTHRILTALDDQTVLAEFVSNKTFLEELTGQEVSFLAYPYGTEGACGQREAELAAQAGFKAAFTTRPGHLFSDHLSTPFLLPRIDVGYFPQRRSALASRLSGFQRARLTGWREPVATLT